MLTYLNRYLIAIGLLCAALPGAFCADTAPQGLSVELKYGTRISLQITLRPDIQHALQVPANELPWGSRDSMVVVAAITGGRCLRTMRPIEDPPFSQTTIEPNSLLKGEIDLQTLFPDLRSVLKQSDVQLFWAYESPVALHIPRWSGGWILIAKTK